MKGRVSTGEVHKPKVRCTSGNSLKRCSSTVIFFVSEEKQKITEFFPDTTVFIIKVLALQTNEIKR